MALYKPKDELAFDCHTFIIYLFNNLINYLEM